MSVAIVEGDSGFLLPLNWQPAVKAERDLVEGFEAAWSQIEYHTRRTPTVEEILKNGIFRKKLRLLLADKVFQKAGRVNLPIPPGDQRAEFFTKCVEMAHVALPSELKVELPTLEVRCVGLPSGQRQRHCARLLPPAKDEAEVAEESASNNQAESDMGEAQKTSGSGRWFNRS